MAISSDSPVVDEADHCLFVANLPQRMTNEELAIALFTIFKPFGTIVSVKASRDQKGRPFGFVEYEQQSAATSALSYAPCLTLDGRRIRVELAKRQRKLCIKHRLQGIPLEVALDEMRRSLQQFVRDEDFKMSLQSGTESDCNPSLGEPAAPLESEEMIAAVVKFEDPQIARQASEVWKKNHPQWSFTWINMDRAAYGSNIRNSGLVQLVPSKDGTFLFPPPPPPPPLPIPAPQSYSLSRSPPVGYAPYEGSYATQLHQGHRYPPTYEEEHYDTSAPSSDKQRSFVEQMEQLSLSPSSTDSLEDWLGKTVFVGRLNGQSITIPLLYERFSKHGPISYIRLYNRGAVGFDGVPLDAYAFVRFQTDGSRVAEAIAQEHGRAWLGQAIKCENARIGALSVLLANRSPPMSPTVYSPHSHPPSHVHPLPPQPLSSSPPYLHQPHQYYFYPQGSPPFAQPFLPYLLPQSPPQASATPNWFRAKKAPLNNTATGGSTTGITSMTNK